MTENGKTSVNSANSMYVFNGERFTTFADIPQFKNSVSSLLETELSETMSVGELYSSIAEQHIDKKHEIDRLFFENILYSDLNHIYLYKFSTPLNLDVQEYKKRVKNIIEYNNHKSYILPTHRHLMNENGFYLMDVLGITVPGAKFIAGHDFKEVEGSVIEARFLFVEVVPFRNGYVGYHIAGVHIDYVKGRFIILTKNPDDIVKYENKTDEEEMDYDHSISGIVNRVQKNIINWLGFISIFDVEADRIGLFTFCKTLDEQMLNEIRQLVSLRTIEQTKTATDTLFNDLFKDCEFKPIPKDKEFFIQKIQSLLISNYISTNVKKSELRKRAKELKLPGYPTRIAFSTKKSSRSSTESAGADNPISASEMFHSLYIDFLQATSLKVFSISWFRDINFEKRNTKVLQTTIYAGEKTFKVVFKTHLPHGKEILFHVLEHIYSCRNYQIQN